MNKVKFIILILAALFSTIFAHTYHATDNGDAADFDALVAGATIAAGEIGLVKADGTAIESVACSSASAIRAALEADTTTSGASGGLKHGSCCINAHHVVCQKMQDAIRSCAHTGKGDTSTSDDAAVCPQ
tara:strand:+ start:181 stop:570 length:390 start_codon:yes stop_codon:yes gene_type:complete